MKRIGIYEIRNKVSNKVYIGQSVDIKDRLRKHRWAIVTGGPVKTEVMR